MNLTKFTCWYFQFKLIYLSCIFYIGEFNASSAEFLTQSDLINGLVYRQKEMLNSSSKGLFGVLEWIVFRNESKIMFTVTKSSTSSKLNLVLGISETGNVDGADFVIISGGSQGPYSVQNMFGNKNYTIEPSSVELWTLEGAEMGRNEIGYGNIKVNLSRTLDTCNFPDQRYICINDDMLYVLWGSDQNLSTKAEAPLSKSFTPEGSLRAFLTDPQILPPELLDVQRNKDIQTWRITRTHEILKTRQTSYWCSIKKAPTLSTPNNIIGYVPYFKDIPSENYVHHQLMYRCVLPPGINSTQIFEPLLDYPGEECFLEDKTQLPMHFCKELVYTWNRGGKSFYFPQNVGIPFGGDSKDEYFLLEIHYDNPSKFEGIKVESGFDVLYSQNIRPVEAGMLLVGVGIFGLYVVPPNGVNFKVGGLCSSGCTKDMFTGKGANSILAVSLHGHMKTHSIKLTHFRGDQELSVILKDENFDSSFQQVRYLTKAIRIMPGDQFGVECVLNTGNKTVLSGFSTRNEMCFAALVLDRRLQYLYCSSEYPTDNTLERFGVQKISWEKELQERVIRKADKHPDWINKTLQSVLDSNFGEWRDKQRNALEREQLFGKHDSVCPPYPKLVRIEYSSKMKITKSEHKNTETVSTYGFLKRTSEWPNLDNSVRMSSGRNECEILTFAVFGISLGILIQLI